MCFAPNAFIVAQFKREVQGWDVINTRTAIGSGNPFCDLLSDERGVKKAAEQLGISYHTIAERQEARSRKQRKGGSHQTEHY